MSAVRFRVCIMCAAGGACCEREHVQHPESVGWMSWGGPSYVMDVSRATTESPEQYPLVSLEEHCVRNICVVDELTLFPILTDPLILGG